MDNLPPVPVTPKKDTQHGSLSPASYGTATLSSKTPTITLKSSRPSARASVINMDPSILEKEIETLDNATKKMGGSNMTLSAGQQLQARKSIAKSKVTHGTSDNLTKLAAKSNHLNIPMGGSKRPTSAPNNIDQNDPNVEEAQINAAFLGNNIKNKNKSKSGSDFTIREQIGKGAFARVHVVKFKSQENNMSSKQFAKTYAIKSLRKADIVKTKQIKHLVTTFQDQKHLYLVLEYIPGGDMFSHIRKHVRFQEPVARFYTYIHSKDPENILIDPMGHIKIADFGFAKVIPRNHATTFCGTPAYMAPEIILKMGYSKAADWWSLGTVCYELMAGYSPILNYELRWSRIMESQPNRRLGMNGAKEIKAHPWFKGVNWKEAEALQVPVPFVPCIEGDGDIRNFDIYTDQSSVITMQNGTMTLTSEDNLYDGMFPDF
ncbi:kinase-like protein [Rhizoclosmatium globosum]|uniref:cAMP-dependent protein kinase n=1 Tax=Rhizoclosmatium globosum TaxID=329046 RepID=A0A1Y2CEM1_9FUNG|nr:kinase-like protein [Rhizoclosmatium globosum]|eukprot:ORY45501.1 kinase-like protein [Rhizoclosmatium globosum]